MKKSILRVEMIVGFTVLLVGFLFHGLGLIEILPVPRTDLVVIGTTLMSLLLIISGFVDIFVKKTKEIEIEEKDERNIAIANAAMASGFKVMSVVLAFTIFALIFMGYMNVVSCFTIIGAFAISQIAFIIRLWYLHKTM